MISLTPPQTEPTIVTGGNADYRLDDDVFLVVQDGMSRVMDFERGRFLGLDETATAMLTGLLERPTEHAAARIAEEYGVPADRVQADLDEFLHSLLRKQIVVRRPTDAARTSNSRSTLFRRLARPIVGAICRVPTSLAHLHTANRPDALRIRQVNLLLTSAWLSLRLLGWRRTIDSWKRLHTALTSVPADGTDAAIARVDELVRQAASQRLLLPMVCKERALAGYQLLRCCFGLPAEIVVGMERHPFRAHAWVECGGRIVTDDPQHCEAFTPVARYA
jgi:hypothetical protein